MYDRRGKLTNINFGDGTTPNVTFAYDPAGRLTSMVDGAGAETYTLDNVGRVTQITRGTDSFAYQYDADGNVTRRTYPDTTAHTATFDNDGRLATVGQWWSDDEFHLRRRREPHPHHPPHRQRHPGEPRL